MDFKIRGCKDILKETKVKLSKCTALRNKIYILKIQMTHNFPGIILHGVLDH